MAKITYVFADGTRRDVDAANGASIMETALRNNVKGIDAECGGCLSCATCHVYVDEAWLAKLPAPDPDETDMLGFVAAEQKPNSRLSCQLKMSEALDGIVVSVQERQS